MRIVLYAALSLVATVLPLSAETPNGPVQGAVQGTAKGTATIGQGIVQGTGQAGQGIAQGSASVARGRTSDRRCCQGRWYRGHKNRQGRLVHRNAGLRLLGLPRSELAASTAVTRNPRVIHEICARLPTRLRYATDRRFSGSPQTQGTHDEPGISQFLRLWATSIAKTRRTKMRRPDLSHSSRFIFLLLASAP
jgi:hypothetical protein